MNTLHPTFDPRTQTWFVEDKEASTLAALLKLLPPKTKLEGYHPNGFNAVRLGGTVGRVYMPVKSSFHLSSSAKRREPTPPQPPKPPAPPPNDNLILNDWATGLNSDVIAKKYPPLTASMVRKMISKARRRGDTRAVPRLNITPHQPRRYDHNAVLNLWAAGLSGPEIGRQLHLHSSTTAAQIVGQYFDKDPRAVRRGPVRPSQ